MKCNTTAIIYYYYHYYYWSADNNNTFCIFLGAIAPELDKDVILTCQTQPFGLLIDESNTMDKNKDLVILARVYDNTLEVVTKFIDLPVCNIGTADSIFAKLESSLR